MQDMERRDQRYKAGAVRLYVRSLSFAAVNVTVVNPKPLHAAEISIITSIFRLGRAIGRWDNFGGWFLIFF